MVHLNGGEIKGNFNCRNYDNLTSLEGAPRKVDGTFYCSGCDNLTSLEGAPEVVNSSFYCYDVLN